MNYRRGGWAAGTSSVAADAFVGDAPPIRPEPAPAGHRVGLRAERARNDILSFPVSLDRFKGAVGQFAYVDSTRPLTQGGASKRELG